MTVWDSVMNFLNYGPEDEYVVMSDSAILTNIDLLDVLDKHIASGKDLTVVTKDGIANGSKQLDLALKLDAKGEEMGMSIRLQREDIFEAMHRV